MSEQSRATRRAYIWENHPDRGGDPARFIEGLHRLQQEGGEVPENRGARSPVVRAYRSRRTAPVRWIRRVRRARRHVNRHLQ